MKHQTEKRQNKKQKENILGMFFEAQIMTQELKEENDHIRINKDVYSLYPESTLGQDNLTPLSNS